MHEKIKRVFVSKTPARLSFSGGGTDLESFYKGRGSIIISTTIDKFFHASIFTKKINAIKIFSSDYNVLEEYPSRSGIKSEGILRLPKDVIKFLNIDFGFELYMKSDVPPGSGLGLSGACTVGLIKVFSEIIGKELSQMDLAMAASEVEINRLGRPIGHQDQLASSFGGLNLIEFAPDGAINVEKIAISYETKKSLESSLMLFYTGKSRDSAVVLERHKDKLKESNEEVIDRLNNIKDITYRMKDSLNTSDIENFGSLLDEYWINKRKAAKGTSDDHFDMIYEKIKELGAFGGKLTGAGHGGFFLVCADPSKQRAIQDYLLRCKFTHYPFKFYPDGSKII
jgi:galactokinase/mevalonate kinase-like predicted kinase